MRHGKHFVLILGYVKLCVKKNERKTSYFRFIPRYKTVGINPQWNAVLMTPKTTPKRSLASGESPILFILILNLRSIQFDAEQWNQNFSDRKLI